MNKIALFISTYIDNDFDPNLKGFEKSGLGPIDFWQDNRQESRCIDSKKEENKNEIFYLHVIECHDLVDESHYGKVEIAKKYLKSIVDYLKNCDNYDRIILLLHEKDFDEADNLSSSINKCFVKPYRRMWKMTSEGKTVYGIEREKDINVILFQHQSFEMDTFLYSSMRDIDVCCLLDTLTKESVL